MRYRTLARVVAPLAVLSLLAAGCGDDDDAAAPAEETEDTTELCELATEMYEQEDFPSAAQIEKYTELAPAEIADAVAVAGPPVAAADGDPVAFSLAQADDDVEDAVFEINEWERVNCGIDYEPRYPAEANEIDPDATRVDVVASEYTFVADPGSIPAGRTSFVMTNAGQEAHFLLLSRINEGHTLEEALAFEGDPEQAGIVTNAKYESGVAAPGGEDEEVVTLDLEPGSWAMLCFISGPDGTPHALMGMAVPFTVE
jgi:hypothetical protein